MAPHELRKLVKSLNRSLDGIERQLIAIVELSKAHYTPEQPSAKPPSPPISTYVSLSPAIESFYLDENIRRSSGRMWRRTERVAAVIGLGAALASVVLTTFTLKQIERQTPALIDSAQAARNAAETATKALQQSVADQRAWVGISGFNVNPSEFRPLTNIVANVEIRNYGREPAFIDEVSTRIEVRSTPVPVNLDYGIPGRKYVLFPGQPPIMSADVSTAVSADDLSAVKKGNRCKLMLHGLVRYHDRSGQHFTTFCLFWSGEDKLFASCNEHNDAT